MRSELGRRVVSAIILGLLVLAATWAGGLAFRAVASAIVLLVFYEWSSMVGRRDRSVLLTAFGWIVAIAGAGLLLAGNSGLALEVLLAGAALAGLWGLFAGRTWWLGGGILYAGLSGVALAGIRGDGSAGLVAMLFVFAVVWATDIAAYFSGRFFGGAKLAARISPSKTWSGAVGGALAGIIAGTAVAFVARAETSPVIPLAALILSAASQAGDLFESWVKRRFGVKDSSHLIPGHGGVMDRVDGLVFAAFAAYLIAAALPSSMTHGAGGSGFSPWLSAFVPGFQQALQDGPRRRSETG